MSDQDDRPFGLRLRAWLVAASVPALVLAGCGAGGDEIPPADAEALRAQLDELQGLVAADDCEGADTQLDEVNETVAEIEERESVDPEIRRGLRRLTDQLNRTFTDDACAPEEEEPVEPVEVEPVEPAPAPEPTTTETEPEPEEPTAPQGRGPEGGGAPGQEGGSTPPGSGTGGVSEEDD